MNRSTRQITDEVGAHGRASESRGWPRARTLCAMAQETLNGGVGSAEQFTTAGARRKADNRCGSDHCTPRGGPHAHVPHHRSRRRSGGHGRPGAHPSGAGPPADPRRGRPRAPGRRPGRRAHHPTPGRRRLPGGAARGRRRGRAGGPRAGRAGRPVRRRAGHGDGGREGAVMSYLNVAEVETALALAGRPANAGFTELITLPHQTWEGRTCSALRIHAGPPARAGVYLLGGVHAREWGSPDILINSVRLLTDAYRTRTGITQGGASISAAQVRQIVDTLDVVVFPQANPDGRQHSMTVDPMWRKNRRPADPGQHCPSGGGSGPGVDLNRNYDFLWDYTTKFSPNAPVRTSTDPCEEVYLGPGAVSEPETANVTWLLDRHRSVTHFIDVHSFGEDILYNWGDDDDQTTDPSMNFGTPAYDGKRGVPDSTPANDPAKPDAAKYREFIPAPDLTEAITLGTTMRDAIQAAHGRQYSVKSAVGLYPTSGTSDDWAYSRSFLDPARGKVLGYTIEWGPQRASIPKSFHPNYPDMVPIIEEITAALLAFCTAVASRTAAPQHANQTTAFPRDESPANTPAEA